MRHLARILALSPEEKERGAALGVNWERAPISEMFLRAFVSKALTYLFDSTPNMLSNVAHRLFSIFLAPNGFLTRWR